MARFEFYDSLERAKDEELRLRYRLAGNRMMLALYRFDALLRKNFNPNQPRVPAGSGDASGEWSRVGGGTTKPQPIQFVPSGQGSESDSNANRPVSPAPRPKTVAASPDPLTPRRGSGRVAQISSTVNDVASGRSTSVRKVIGNRLESTEVRIERQPDSRVTIDISPSIGRLKATGTLSSEPGKVTISDLNLTAPGLFNPLRVDSVPKQVSISDGPDGTLRIQADGRLTVSAPLVGNFDLLPGKVLIITD